MLMNDNDVFWAITNNNGGPRIINTISITWPVVPDNQVLNRFYSSTAVIWEGVSFGPTTSVTTGEWIGPVAARTVNQSGTIGLQFEYGLPVQGGSFSVSVTFDDGCNVSILQTLPR